MSERRSSAAPDATRAPQPPPPDSKPGSSPPPVQDQPPPDPANVPPDTPAADPQEPAEKLEKSEPSAVAVAEAVPGKALYFRETTAAQSAWSRARASGATIIGAVTALARVPQGWGLAMNVVRIDTRDMNAGGEIYRIAGERYGLSKAAIYKLCATAGLSWVPEEGGRQDDGRRGDFCHWRAVAKVRDLTSGAERKWAGEKVIDLRPGTSLYKQWERAAAEKAAKDRRPEQAEAYFQRRLDEYLPHITSQAETKAMLRCARAALALLTAYNMDTLKRPFVVPMLVRDSSTIEDPELRKEVIRMEQMHAMGLVPTLYGQRPPQRVHQPAPYAAPPVPAEPAPLEDDDDDLSNGYA